MRDPPHTKLRSRPPARVALNRAGPKIKLVFRSALRSRLSRAGPRERRPSRQKPPQGDAQIHRCAPRSGAESLLKNPPTSSLHTPTATAHACASSQPSAAGPSQDQSRKKAQNPRSTTASHRSHDQDAAAAYAGCARPACVDGVRSARRRRNGCAPPPAREPESSRHGSRLRGVGERRL